MQKKLNQNILLKKQKLFMILHFAKVSYNYIYNFLENDQKQQSYKKFW